MKIIGAHGLTDEIGLSVVNVICVFFTLFVLDILCDCFITFGNCIIFRSGCFFIWITVTEHLWHNSVDLTDFALLGSDFYVIIYLKLNCVSCLII